MGITPEYHGPQLMLGDYAYWVCRDGAGHTRGFRQFLRGNKPDPAFSKESLVRADLPSEVLQRQYDVLVSGGVPSEIFRQDNPAPATQLTA